VQAQNSSSTIPIYIQGQKKSFDSPPILKDGRVFLPIRYISEYFGAQVTWDDQTKTVAIKQGSKTISLQIGNSVAQIDGKEVSLDVPAFINGARTYVPLRFIGEALGRYVDWDQTERAVYIDTDAVSSTMQMSFGGKTFNVKVVKVFLNNPHVGLKIAYGQNQIGLTESLLSMAQRSNAIAAINGTFFRAYETTNPKEPSGNLIIDGRIEHLCFRDKPATTFGFTRDNRADIAYVSMKIQGQYLSIPDPDNVWLYDQGWYVGTINRSPIYWGQSSINLYTPKRGPTTRANNGGINVVVENDTVVDKKQGNNVAIPKNGYIIHLYGTELRYADWFQKGYQIEYNDIYSVQQGNASIWKQGVIEGGLSAGPRLITNGKITVNPGAENYTIPKITEYSMARSALGLTKDNKLLMVTVNSAKIEDLATIMQKLGAYNAMNIDGGASSGLYYKGKLLTSPGRDLSNALLVIRK
jgi:exopolysaccharide biosynthesis protein